jgi:hypothetical protein
MDNSFERHAVISNVKGSGRFHLLYGRGMGLVVLADDGLVFTVIPSTASIGCIAVYDFVCLIFPL